MGSLRDVENHLQSTLATGEMDQALHRWSTRHPCLRDIAQAEDLVGLFRQVDGDRERKERILRALTTRAKVGDEPAGILLIGLYLPSFRRTRREIGSCTLTEEELEAEMLTGFWEEVTRPHPIAVSVTSRLFYAIQNRAWKAVRASSRAMASAVPISTSEVASHGGSSSALEDSPELMLDLATREGILSRHQAQLIRATRLEGFSIEELAAKLGTSCDALKMKRSRAERRLIDWLRDSRNDRSDDIRPTKVTFPASRSRRARVAPGPDEDFSAEIHA